jgi:putative acetyltransferase
MVMIRREQQGDEAQIRTVNLQAFGRETEANLVDEFRINCPEGVSLVAVEDDRIVGHILFTPAMIESGERMVHGMCLAPLAVLPEFQRQGIGTKLIQAGFEAMKAAHQSFVILYGHPEYYPRFGFVPASRYGIKSPYDGVPPYDSVPDEAFMIFVFDEAALEGVSGVTIERPEFAAALSSLKTSTEDAAAL